jgi:hypothetical protein
MPVSYDKTLLCHMFTPKSKQMGVFPNTFWLQVLVEKTFVNASEMVTSKCHKKEYKGCSMYIHTQFKEL